VIRKGGSKVLVPGGSPSHLFLVLHLLRPVPATSHPATAFGCTHSFDKLVTTWITRCRTLAFTVGGSAMLVKRTDLWIYLRENRE
jgi:hypothetical protein